MSLLKQKKENDRIAAEAAAKAKEAAILRELAVHPVVKARCNRDIRDSYFLGLIFAAIADDEKVDVDERLILGDIVKSMSLGEGEVDDAITLVAKMSVEDKIQLIKECLCAIKDRESIVKLFYAQFAELWMTGEYDLGELKEYADMFKAWTGVAFPSAQMKNMKVVVSNSAELNSAFELNSALDDLAAWMGDDELKYFALHRHGDVTSRIEQSKKVSGFFDAVSAVVEEMGILNDIRTDASTLKRFRSLLAKKGLETVDTDKTYQAIHDVFISAYNKKQTELFRLHCQVSWAVIALCVLKKDITAAAVSQFNGLLRDAHRQGKYCFYKDQPSYFWSIYLHGRAKKVLGLDRVKDK